MGSQSFQPKWWTEEHASTWDNVKDAMKRDWEQTKKDLHLGGTELNQEVGDTVNQATGKEPVPPANTPNWEEAEQPLRYGVGARARYGAQHSRWNDNLESTLKNDWESSGVGEKWSDVKNIVRHGYDRPSK